MDGTLETAFPSLPNELEEHIFTFLSSTELGKCLSTSKGFCNTIKSSKWIWNRKRREMERREGPRIVREFKRILKDASAENLMAAVVDIEKRLGNVEHNLTTGGGLCVGRCESGSLEGEIYWDDFDVDFNSEILAFYLHSVLFYYEDNLLAVHQPYHIRIVSLRDLKTLSSFPVTTAFTEALSKSFEKIMVKDHLVFASYEREILVFDWKKKEQIQSLETGNKCASTLNSYSCVHGDRMAAIADEDMTIKVWKLDSNYERFDPEASLFAAQVMERWTNVTIDAETLTGLTKAVTGQRCIRRFSLLNGTEESTIRVDVGEADFLRLNQLFVFKCHTTDHGLPYETSVADLRDPSLAFNPTNYQIDRFRKLRPNVAGKFVSQNYTYGNGSRIYRVEESEAGFKKLSSAAIPMSCQWKRYGAGDETDGFSIVSIGDCFCRPNERFECWAIQIRHFF